MWLMSPCLKAGGHKPQELENLEKYDIMCLVIKMEYSYKFQLYPNTAQIQQIQRTFGCCRYVWNHYLALRKESYEQDKKRMNYYDCAGDMTQLKKAVSWLKEIDATALQSSLRDLDAAYQNFFRQVKQEIGRAHV